MIGDALLFLKEMHVSNVFKKQHRVTCRWVSFLSLKREFSYFFSWNQQQPQELEQNRKSDTCIAQFKSQGVFFAVDMQMSFSNISS